MNTITGNAFANELDGGTGDGTRIGALGVDALRGGADDGLYRVDEGDILAEEIGEGIDTIDKTQDILSFDDILDASDDGILDELKAAIRDIQDLGVGKMLW